MTQLDNKRIAKNAVLLTLRMIVVTIIGLFTSRIILQALGVEDYGVYNLVGGIVGICNFLNAAMSGATSRFITFEIGTGNIGKLKKIVATSLSVHCLIALAAIVVAETVGLWIVNYKLVIPEGSMFAANVVYQLSVLSLAVGFTQVPYSAMIMAYEKMNIYAYFEILNVAVRLGVVFLVASISNARLEWYAIMLFGWSVIQAMFYRFYCIRNFKLGHFSWSIDKPVAKEMLTYSGFDLFGNLSCTVYFQGLPIVLNTFFGVIANTAAGIGGTIDGTVKGFSWAVSNAFVPQITKQYAAGNIRAMEDVMGKAMKFTVLVFALIGLPFVLETERIIYLWLGQVPPYTVEFARCIMLVTIIDYITMSNNRAIHATGHIKWISLISGNFYLIAPFVAYGIMKLHTPAYTPYLVNATMLTIVAIIGIILLKRQIPEYNVTHYVWTLIRIYGVVALSLLIMWGIKESMISWRFPYEQSSFIETVIIVAIEALLGLVVLGTLSLTLVFNASERHFIAEKIKAFCSKIGLYKHRVSLD